jgi:hypothetical protein
LFTTTVRCGITICWACSILLMDWRIMVGDAVRTTGYWLQRLLFR